MNSRIASRKLRRAFLPISLAILLRANGASAAAPVGSSPQQARDLLSSAEKPATAPL
jgi:hypothetical protein